MNGTAPTVHSPAEWHLPDVCAISTVPAQPDTVSRFQKCCSPSAPHFAQNSETQVRWWWLLHKATQQIAPAPAARYLKMAWPRKMPRPYGNKVVQKPAHTAACPGQLPQVQGMCTIGH
ncbi:hypothetical protein NPIL_193181 [Nephila pilipes]|uniref:Uncharacterized protein n=1 Tax=Nephila pilipes TaxID=299642 RepID=A0A8X6ND49_NEPPI|nr:hypothetical protein NPIL_193181 [Nephila pilipes]